MTMSYSDLKRGVKLPNKSSKELIEFFGILTGDGYTGKYRNNHVVEISGNKIKDKKF